MIQPLRQLLADYRPQPIGNRREFAVLLPLYEGENGFELIYEVRSEHISQPGETSFPGGAVETGEHPSDAAVRETHEELGVPMENIQLLGEVDYVISEMVIIYAYVAVLKDYIPGTYEFNQQEVAEVMHVPISWLQANPPTYYGLPMQPLASSSFPWERIPGGKSYQWSRRRHQVGFYPIPPNGLNIWGFTALMTDNLIQLIDLADHYPEGFTKNND